MNDLCDIGVGKVLPHRKSEQLAIVVTEAVHGVDDVSGVVVLDDEDACVWRRCLFVPGEPLCEGP